jgi:hypothetical protein
MGSHRSRTGRPRTWNISSEESCPSTRPKLGDWLGAPSRSFYGVMKRSCTTAAPRAFSNNAYPLPKDKSCYKKYTRGACGHHATPRALVGNAFRQGFYWPTAVADATRIVRSCWGVNSTRDRRTCPLRHYRQYLSLGRLPCGVWTSSVPCRRHPGASRTCWLPSTNSPSGSKSDP